jgi:hypothetical protein
MVGKGAVQTSSPFSPRGSARPSSSNTSTRIPSKRHCSSPRHTGRMGEPPAKQATRSVPPLIDDRMRSFFTFEYT